jgi:hypothetical protein
MVRTILMRTRRMMTWVGVVLYSTHYLEEGEEDTAAETVIVR